MVWQGEVEGRATFYVKGKRLEVEQKQATAVQRQHSHFYHPLPDEHVDVRLEKLGGRGDVRILEQPALDNNYTLAVSIEDRQSGSSPYSLAFYWDTSTEKLQQRRSSSSGGRVTWKGHVDGEVVVACHQSICDANATAGRPVLRESFKFSKPLPASDVEVTLESSEGRGEIRLLDQPLEKNGYTARVLIRDPDRGAGDYRFTLTWARPAAPEDTAAQLGLIWRGRVDGRIRVVVRGGAAFCEVLDGRPVAGDNANFYRPLSSLSNSNVIIKKLSGRGQATITQLPAVENHFELAFEIDSRATGPDDYQIEVDW